MKNICLAIDIGNTAITCGIFTHSRLSHKFSLPTVKYTFAALSTELKSRDRFLDDIIISSVVPRISNRIEVDCRKYFGKTPYTLGKNMAVPIKNAYSKPKQVGQDRLVNAFAGVMRHGSPLIVVDFGTAVTFDCISKERAYLGGMILPGLGISLDALHQRTALLPAVKLAAPKEFIGRDTRTSILSGVVYGMACLTDELCQRIKAKIGKSAKVIGTGGNIKLISRYCHKIDIIDPDLTLKGLYSIYSSCGSD
jgi:type III pantothenate kinase